MKFKNWFKFGWFTSKDRELLKKTNETVERIEKEVSVVLPKPVDASPPYKNLIYSNGNLTVVFSDGMVLDKMSVDREFFDEVKGAYNKDVILGLMIDNSPPPPKEENAIETLEERQIIADNLGILRDHPDFVINGTQVTLKGVSLPIPASVLASFIEILERSEMIQEEFRQGRGDSDFDYLVIEDENLFCQYQALKMFWLKLALNPLPQSREDLLSFCRRNDVRISNNGNLILYRRIVSKAGADIKYVAFISQSYYSLKKKGQDPRSYAIGKKPQGAYYVVDLREDDFAAEELIGNLQHLYLELPDYENNSFTAAHDKSMKIKIGAIYSIPNEKINLDNGLCAAGGLHAAAVDYNYSGFGDTMVVVLVNPSKAITVPKFEMGKLRTTEMFIACINDKPQGTHFDEEALTSFDEEYHDFTLAQLENAARNNNFEGLNVQDNLPEINLADLKRIKEMLKARIKSIV